MCGSSACSSLRREAQSRHVSAGYPPRPVRLPAHRGPTDSYASREESDMGDDAKNIQEHLRAASDAILLLLTEVGQLERHKRAIPPGEARFDEVARATRAAAAMLAEFTEHEETWAEIATDGRSDLEPIDRSANADSVDAILKRWRAIERQLDELQPGSPEAMRLFEEFERARDDYMAAFREQKEAAD